MKYEIKEIKGTLKVLTGLHIGAGDSEMHIGGIDGAVVKNIVTNEPYIPGSSLKGKMRSLLTTCGVERGLIDKLFGHSADDNSGDITRLSFRDCFLTKEWKDELQNKDIFVFTEAKMENVINRNGQAMPRTIERVLAGSKFDFQLNLKVVDGEENLLDVVKKGLKLLEMDSLGGSGSRGYGKIEFSDLTLNGEKFDLPENIYRK